MTKYYSLLVNIIYFFLLMILDLMIYFAVCSNQRNLCNLYRTSTTSTLRVYNDPKAPTFQSEFIFDNFITDQKYQCVNENILVTG